MKIYLDPSYPYYYHNRIFAPELPFNRDDRLQPTIRLKEAIVAQGSEIATADALDPDVQEPVLYFSHGIDVNYRKLKRNPHIRMYGFMIYEPPLVAPHLYRQLPELTRVFENVFVHNTVGDAYALAGVDQSKLRKLYVPMPYRGVLEPYWSRQDRMNKLVVINSNHNPYLFAPYRRTFALPRRELYSQRIRSMVDLERSSGGNFVDLYGGRWADWWSPFSLWWPYWRHRSRLMKIYRGFAESKYGTLSSYEFSLCFENMSMKGYVSEKIFDCLYAGTIPIYLGAADIEQYVPAETFIDFRRFGSSDEAHDYLMTLSVTERQDMRDAGREFLQSEGFKRFYDASILELAGITGPN